jgi:site-specific DNA recombinase
MSKCKRAAIYVRVSDHQMPEANVEEQKKAAIDFCQQRGWSVVAEYVDDGFFASNDNRPAFNRMVAEAVSGTDSFDYVVAFGDSRYFRDRFKAEIYRQRLREAGVEIVKTTGDMSVDLMNQVKAVFDAYEAQQRSARIKSGLAAKKLREGGKR